MLSVSEDIVAFKMVMDWFGYDVLKNFAVYSSKGDWPIVRSSGLVIIFISKNYMCFQPV